MEKVKIPISAKVLYQMYEYAHSANKHFGTEIAGWGHYNKNKGIYKLAPLLKQEVSSAEVDVFPNDLLNDVKYDISDMLVQWHSHVNFSCSPSMTDQKQIEEALELMPMIISVIVNCKQEHSVMVSFKQAGAFEFQEIIKLDAVLVPYYDDRVGKEVKSKLFKPAPKPVSHNVVYHKGQHGVWQHGVFVPVANVQKQNLSVLIPPVDDDLDLFVPDYSPPRQDYKAMALFDDMAKVIYKAVSESDSLEIREYHDYIIVRSEEKDVYVEISPRDIKYNAIPCEWETALTKLGLDASKYPLSKK